MIIVLNPFVGSARYAIQQLATWKDQQKLLAAVTPDAVVGAQLIENAPRQFSEDGVSRVMAQFVIDCFEVIDVDQHDANRYLLPPRATHFSPQHILNTGTIHHLRQDIVSCRLTHFRSAGFGAIQESITRPNRQSKHENVGGREKSEAHRGAKQTIGRLRLPANPAKHRRNQDCRRPDPDLASAQDASSHKFRNRLKHSGMDNCVQTGVMAIAHPPQWAIAICNNNPLE